MGCFFCEFWGGDRIGRKRSSFTEELVEFLSFSTTMFILEIRLKGSTFFCNDCCSCLMCEH